MCLSTSSLNGTTPFRTSFERSADDLAPLGISLSLGRVYHAEARGYGITFKTDSVRAQDQEVVSRLLSL
jgi:hypothetical protein